MGQFAKLGKLRIYLLRAKQTLAKRFDVASRPGEPR
jgi:hypothetical protein